MASPRIARREPAPCRESSPQKQPFERAIPNYETRRIVFSDQSSVKKGEAHAIV
jgi:hypothetical protein